MAMGQAAARTAWLLSRENTQHTNELMGQECVIGEEGEEEEGEELNEILPHL